MQDTRGKVVLITGASSGFGRSIALLLSKNGYRVFGTSRNPKSGKADGFELIKLDVTSDKSVKSCIETVIRRAGRIDILVNNAGYISSGGLEESSMEDARSQFETNFFGVVRMVNMVLPTMRKRRSGQLINISSVADTLQAPFQGYYAATKAALTSYTESLRLEVKQFGIKVSVVEPGIFNTNLFNIQKKTAKTIPVYSAARRKTLRVIQKGAARNQDPSIVAATVLCVIETENPKIRYPVGREKMYLTLKRLLPESFFESQQRKAFGLDD